jgi:hypothetical protein
LLSSLQDWNITKAIPEHASKLRKSFFLILKSGSGYFLALKTRR